MPLVDHFIPLLACLREFQQAPRDDAATLGARLTALIESARNTASEQGIAAEDYQAALFPIVAWADEALIALAWAGASEWPKRLLQKRYFNLSTAGIEFFKRLEQLERDADELKEVYLVCLCLGFQGRYSYDRDPKALADIREQLLASLSPGASATGELLIPEAYRGHSPFPMRQPKPRWRWQFSSLNPATVAIPLLALVGLYGAYHLIINHMVNSLSQRL